MLLRHITSAPKVQACKLFNILLLVYVVNFLLGCQELPLQVYSTTDANVNLRQYQTFSVHAESHHSTNFIAFITRGIESGLTVKGYSVSETPDLLINYRIEIDRGELITQEQIPDGTGFYTSNRIDPINKADVLVNAIDRKTKEVVWKAATSMDISSVNIQNIDQNRVSNHMAQLFKSFPSR
tara:strand:+ start:3722 stop:4267 length:546 start_codon:yes stop_codon:yes gene_type:complete